MAGSIDQAWAKPHQFESKWLLRLGDAPGFPQDIQLKARGNNKDGWKTRGYIEVGPLAQCCFEGDHVLVEMTVFEAGIYGEDGFPVEPGTYEITSDPDRDGVPDTLIQTLGGEETYFYVLFEGLVIESNEPPGYPVPVGFQFTAMFTFPYVGERGHVVDVATWVDNGQGFEPLLNEGPMKYQIHEIDGRFFKLSKLWLTWLRNLFD